MTTSEQIAAILADRPYTIDTHDAFSDLLYCNSNDADVSLIATYADWDFSRVAQLEANRLNDAHQQAQFEKLIAAEKAPLVEALREIVYGLTMEWDDGLECYAHVGLDIDEAVDTARAALEKAGVR